MKFKAIVRKDGTVVTEVLDRQEHLCSAIYKVTNSVGQQLSDEETGPECDTQREGVVAD
jgi:hypothetical protein